MESLQNKLKDLVHPNDLEKVRNWQTTGTKSFWGSGFAWRGRVEWAARKLSDLLRCSSEADQHLPIPSRLLLWRWGIPEGLFSFPLLLEIIGSSCWLMSLNITFESSGKVVSYWGMPWIENQALPRLELSMGECFAMLLLLFSLLMFSLLLYSLLLLFFHPFASFLIKVVVLHIFNLSRWCWCLRSWTPVWVFLSSRRWTAILWVLKTLTSHWGENIYSETLKSINNRLHQISETNAFITKITTIPNEPVRVGLTDVLLPSMATMLMCKDY